MWKHTGQQRPDFAIEPGPDQESVWDYPRPPRLEEDPRQVRVILGDVEIARSRNTIRVLETASPPTFYIPPDDVDRQWLQRIDYHTYCEWKGQADYYNVVVPGDNVARAAWSYPEPSDHFAAIAGWLSFYAASVRCFVESEEVNAQAGSFYGGWVTSEIVGPFKGDPGTGGW